MWQITPPELPIVFAGDAVIAPPLSDAWAVSCADCERFIALSDSNFLGTMSTSPDAEGPDFVPFLKAVLRFVHSRVSALEAGADGS